MVKFVLKNDCRQAAKIHFYFFAVFVKRLNFNAPPAFDGAPAAGDAQTAFLAFGFKKRMADNFRIDEGHGLTHGNNRDSLRHPDLIGNQTDAVGFFHRFDHINDKRLEFRRFYGFWINRR